MKLKKHFTVKLNGLDDIPSEIPSCSFLTYEDFNTTGLEGDILQDAEEDGVNNPFYYFFRAENQSGKIFDKGPTLGTHGLGKVSFLMSSKVKALFGLTVRSSDSKSYLAGISTLKCHKLDGQDYLPDGWLGRFENDDTALPLPLEETENPDLFNDFKNTFHHIA